jgi:hypothetical protein
MTVAWCGEDLSVHPSLFQNSNARCEICANWHDMLMESLFNMFGRIAANLASSVYSTSFSISCSSNTSFEEAPAKNQHPRCTSKRKAGEDRGRGPVSNTASNRVMRVVKFLLAF